MSISRILLLAMLVFCSGTSCMYAQSSKKSIVNKTTTTHSKTATKSVTTKSTSTYDCITLKNGNKIYCIVQKIGVTEIEYKKKDNLNGPIYSLSKDEVSVIQYKNGTKDIFDQQTTTNHVTTPTNDQNSTQLSYTNGKNLLSKIDAIQPYISYKKGTILEYKAEVNGEEACLPYSYLGPYIQHIVQDVKEENGNMVVYVQSRFLKKDREYCAERKYWWDITYRTEIEQTGQYKFNHDIAYDTGPLKSREGYGVLMLPKFQIGQQLTTSTIIDRVLQPFGNAKWTKEYHDFVVEGFESITTPAGTFDCVRISGAITSKMKFYSTAPSSHCTYWFARGIGVVRIDFTAVNKKGEEKGTINIILNSITSQN